MNCQKLTFFTPGYWKKQLILLLVCCCITLVTIIYSSSIFNSDQQHMVQLNNIIILNTSQDQLHEVTIRKYNKVSFSNANKPLQQKTNHLKNNDKNMRNVINFLHAHRSLQTGTKLSDKNLTNYVNFDQRLQEGELQIAKASLADNTFVIDILSSANTNPCQGNISVVIFLISASKNWEQRAAIRRTWGSVVYRPFWPPHQRIYHKIKIIFVIARLQNKSIQDKVEAEMLKFKDIIQGDYDDSYSNLTLKSLIMLKYASQHCKHVPYLVKCDDDMFLHIPFLLEMLFVRKTLAPRSMMGACISHGKVLRKEKSEVPIALFPYQSYPLYLSGMLYVISMDIVQELYMASQSIPLLPIEDAYITGILAKFINAKHVCSSSMISPSHANELVTPCSIINKSMIAYIQINIKRLYYLWQQLMHNVKCTQS